MRKDTRNLVISSEGVPDSARLLLRVPTSGGEGNIHWDWNGIAIGRTSTW